MISEEAVTRFLQSAPRLTAPTELLARLRSTIDDEVELRRASTVEPELDLPDLKARSPLWSDNTVNDA